MLHIEIRPLMWNVSDGVSCSLLTWVFLDPVEIVRADGSLLLLCGIVFLFPPQLGPVAARSIEVAKRTVFAAYHFSLHYPSDPSAKFRAIAVGVSSYFTHW